jgi:hypothetical protein
MQWVGSLLVLGMLRWEGLWKLWVRCGGPKAQLEQLERWRFCLASAWACQETSSFGEVGVGLGYTKAEDTSSRGGSQRVPGLG